jgi:hypothetical protein
MLFSLITYVLAGVHVLLPVHLAVRLWRRRFRTIGAWGIEAGVTLVTLVALYLFGRWDIVGYGLRYWIAVPCLAGAVASVVRVADRPWAGPNGLRWRGGALMEGALFTGLLIWGGMGYAPERPAVDLAPPLHGPGAYVVHGGGTPPINYHGAVSTAQRYALDLNRLNGWGLRADGLRPDRLSDYAVYGDTVYSPLTGTAVEAVDRFPDRFSPDDQPAVGNHLWLRRDALYVVLAHLQQGSVQVAAGEQVERGQPVARVGHTGNTTEPHLHMHAVRCAEPCAVPDSLADAPPVPVTLNGRFLVRNDVLWGPDERRPPAQVHAPRSPR